MINYKPGHFVKLKDDFFISNKDKIDVCYSPNVFEIEKIENENVYLNHLKVPIFINVIEPIPINGKDDECIYAEFAPIAQKTSLDMEKQPKYTDYSYYLPRIKFGNDNKLSNKQFLKKHNFKYVHEVQDYLYRELNRQPLEINKYKST